MDSAYTPAKTGYQRWMEQEGVPIFEGLAVEDVTELPLKPWKRLGGQGSYIQLLGGGGVTGMYVVEIPGGGALNPERHLYDKVLYVLKGRGGTEVWQEGQKRQTFEWGDGSIFAPPLNTWHRLVNGAREPAVVLAVTTAPMVLDLFRDPEFVFNINYQFKSRYRGEEDYFQTGNKRYQANKAKMWDTNFIADARSTLLDDATYKTTKGQTTCFEMSDNCLVGHISDWPAGIYHNAHYHAAGAILLVLRSTGYLLMWPKELGIHPYQSGREDKIVKFNWKPGSIYSPPDGWFHQHLNTGNEPARHVAVRLGSRRNPTAFHDATGGRERVTNSIREGGTVIKYDDEDPQIRKEFEEALGKNGVSSQMPPVTYRTDPIAV